MELETSHPHPNPQPSLHHRKIELQSPLDLTYLQQNLANFASAKLDLHFPPIPPAPKPATVINLGGSVEQDRDTTKSSKRKRDEEEEKDEDEDPLQTRVKGLISEFLTKTWQTAQTNLTINGLDASTMKVPHTATLSKPSPLSNPTTETDKQTTDPTPEIEGRDFQYAPFDPRLSHRLASLHADLEKLTAEVSALRRTAPKQSAQNYETALSTALAQDDTHQDSQIEQIINKQDLDNLQLGLDQSQLQTRKGWNEDVKELFERGLQELGSLAGLLGGNSNGNGNGKEDGGDHNGTMKMNINHENNKPSMTETMGKVQRAHKVALEME